MELQARHAAGEDLKHRRINLPLLRGQRNLTRPAMPRGRRCVRDPDDWIISEATASPPEEDCC